MSVAELTAREREAVAGLGEFARTLDPSAVILVKDSSPLMRALAIVVALFNKTFMATYATTICNRVYVPRAWLGRDLRRLLVHEVRGHVRQCRACGLGIHPWVGFPIYAVLYLLVFFPVLLAWPRYRLELAADAAAWEWSLNAGDAPADVRARADSFAETVAGWGYLSPWFRPLVLRGFRLRADRVVGGRS